MKVCGVCLSLHTAPLRSRAVAQQWRAATREARWVAHRVRAPAPLPLRASALRLCGHSSENNTPRCWAFALALAVAEGNGSGRREERRGRGRVGARRRSMATSVAHEAADGAFQGADT